MTPNQVGLQCAGFHCPAAGCASGAVGLTIPGEFCTFLTGFCTGFPCESDFSCLKNSLLSVLFVECWSCARLTVVQRAFAQNLGS